MSEGKLSTGEHLVIIHTVTTPAEATSTFSQLIGTVATQSKWLLSRSSLSGGGSGDIQKLLEDFVDYLQDHGFAGSLLDTISNEQAVEPNE